MLLRLVFERALGEPHRGIQYNLGSVTLALNCVFLGQYQMELEWKVEWY